MAPSIWYILLVCSGRCDTDIASRKLQAPCVCSGHSKGGGMGPVCDTNLLGRNMCYVDEGACSDGIPSTTEAGQELSHIACQDARHPRSPIARSPKSPRSPRMRTPLLSGSCRALLWPVSPPSSAQPRKSLTSSDKTLTRSQRVSTAQVQVRASAVIPVNATRPTRVVYTPVSYVARGPHVQLTPCRERA